jgi:hypothetical protein
MANVTFVSNPQPAPACYPPDVNALLHILAEGGGLSGTVPDNSGGGIYVGTIPPASALTNKVWFQIDGAGRPLGIKMYYNGSWRKVYTGVTYGEIRMFWYYSGQIDGTGRGNVGGDMDGWTLCNGQNGAPNLQAFTPVCGVQGETVGQAAGVWFTDADGLAWRNTGGQKARIQLQANNLPAMRVRTGIFGATGGPSGFNLSDGADGSGTAGYGTATVRDTNMNPVGGQAGLPYQNLYVALGFFMFVGYA